MIGFKKDKCWSDNFIPEIKRAVATHLICESPIEEDQERNTDLIVLKLNTVRVACRIRREKWIKNSDEFTIREGRPNGAKTELAKIIEGWGDFIFYGFGSDDGTKLISWKLGDLSVFRSCLFRHMHQNEGRLPGLSIKNYDGSSSFRIYQWSDFENMIVGES
jgi:hypothetical protein